MVNVRLGLTWRPVGARGCHSAFERGFTMRRIIVPILAAVLAAPASGALIMDAAELDRFGAPLETAAVRPIVDNSAGVADMTDVRFRIDYTGVLGGIFNYGWEDADNPWLGAPGGADAVLHDGKLYRQGNAFYPQTGEWGPYFSVDPTPKDAADWWNDYELFDTVPAGIRWDLCVKLLPFGDSEIHVFSSPARGVLAAGGGETIVYDDDPMPQTVPEPAAVILLVVGVAAMLRTKDKP